MHDLTSSRAGLPLHGRRFTRRQEEVLDVIEDVFYHEGLRQVTVGELASRARCSRRTLYELAASKEELFLLVLDRLMRRLARTARDAVANEEDPVDRVSAYLRGGLFVLEPFSSAFSEAIEGYPPAGWLFDHHWTAAIDSLVGLINDAIARGAFRDDLRPDVAAQGIVGGTRRLMEPSFLNSFDGSAAEALDDFFSMMVSGMGGPALQGSLAGRVRRS
jgi:AcrR family transcriptional regulator